MRAANLAPVAGVALIVACGASSPVSTTARQPASSTTCDLRDHISTRRAWLTTGTTPVALFDVAHDQLQVATVRDDVIVTSWVTVDALAPVVDKPTAVSPTAGAAADPGLTVLAGFRIQADTAPWLAIHTGPSLAISGFIPASARATFWDEEPVDPKAPTYTTISVEMTVRAEPRRDAPIRGVLHPGARVRAVGRNPSGAPWIEVDARGAYVAVTGFVEPPTPAPRGDEAECCGEIDYGPPASHGFWQSGACLYDAPGGTIVGEVIGDVIERPTPGTSGWSSITVATGWGDVRYHARTPILEPPPVQPTRTDETFEWPYSHEYWR